MKIFTFHMQSLKYDMFICSIQMFNVKVKYSLIKTVIFFIVISKNTLHCLGFTLK